MSAVPLATHNQFLRAQRQQIHDQWLSSIAALSSRRMPDAVQSDHLRMQTATLLDEIAKVLAAYPGEGLWELSSTHPLMPRLREPAQSVSELDAGLPATGDMLALFSDALDEAPMHRHAAG